ncbi:DNA-binding protein [Paraburkholderia sp. BL10I2N1]|uniref:DNA-binding protein n=1 Tax=Paraburkholderia sp. BL10I2N1 TaxID=1938796 RepID=UPI0010619805|nr:DNA-binding protein [Paraburkholderia sp. BL10I2N1]TDN59150.1 plasmid replication DNA-binding protein KfrA [Paraburkholderia sp. BL10I2N1]
MSRISDTRIRTRDAATRLVAAGRCPHELTVDLIYAEIRQGSRTTINDELKLWKDEQARHDALAAALPPPVANAMLSLWALAVEHGEQVFAQRGEELEREATDATARAESSETAHAALEAQAQTLRAQLEDREVRLAAATAELARAQAEHDTAVREVQTVAAGRDAARANAEEALRAARATHMRELETLRAEHAEREAALRVQIDQATARLEGVQKRVMLQTEEARDAQRRAEAALAKIQQRNEQLVGDVQRLTAEAGEQRRLAERHEKQLAGVMDEARELRRERDALAQQVALLQGQLNARAEPAPTRATRRSRQAT